LDKTLELTLLADGASAKSRAIPTARTWSISACVQSALRRAALDGIAAEFNVEDALRPKFRERLEAARQQLQVCKERLLVLGVDVILREPLAEELYELHGWVREQA
jgi:hypothetical protein